MIKRWNFDINAYFSKKGKISLIKRVLNNVTYSLSTPSQFMPRQIYALGLFRAGRVAAKNHPRLIHRTNWSNQIFNCLLHFNRAIGAPYSRMSSGVSPPTHAPNRLRIEIWLAIQFTHQYTPPKNKSNKKLNKRKT